MSSLGEDLTAKPLEDENDVSDLSNESALLQHEEEDIPGSEDEDETSLENPEEIEDVLQEENISNLEERSLGDDFAENVDFPDVQDEDEAAATEEVHEKSKLARSIRAPSRFDNCMLDLSDISEPLPEEISKSFKKMKSVKFAIESSSQDELVADQSASGSPTPSSDKEESFESLFDAEGNFRFKLGKEHIIRSRIGGLNSYRCDICEMIFPRSFSLRRHYERIHINPRFVRNKGKKDEEMVRKLIDNDRKNELMRRNKGYVTPIVKIKDGSEDQTESTEEEKLDESKPDDPSFYVYACKLCARPQIFFKTKDSLRSHYHTRHTAIARIKSEAFKCETCDRTYATRHELHRHRRSHSGERPYACRYCGKRFPTSTNARRHERTHTGDRPHSCKVCGKGFIQKTDMSKHLRTVHRLKVTRSKTQSTSVEGDSMLAGNANSENQFEENIDFAAYLNLDQFEKGSLMGGSEVEPQFLNSSPSGTGSILAERRNLEKEEEDTKSKEIGSKDDMLESETPHKCPDCAKSFSSKVNMRRHYRLKHERNQAVRSALPVSMVVRKYKIQEADERELKDAITHLKQDSDFPTTKNVSSETTRMATSSFKTNPAKSTAHLQDAFPGSSSPKPPSLGVKSPFRAGKLAGGKQSKLGMILDRLTMKKASNEKSSDRPLSDLIRPVRKENLISSDTLLQSMQPKKKLPVRPAENTVKSHQHPFIPKEKDPIDVEQKVTRDNKARQLDLALKDKIRRDELYLKSRQERKLQSFIKNRLFERSETSKRVFPSLRTGFPSHHASRKDPPRGSFVARSSYSDRNRSLFQNNRESLRKDFLKDRNSKQFSPVFNPTKDRARSFLDNCWSNKMNNLSENKSPFQEGRSWHPAIESNRSSKRPFTFQQSSSPFISFKGESASHLQGPSSSDKVISSNTPLDLTKKKNDPTHKSLEYSVTNDGVLDLSTAKSSKLPSYESGIDVKRKPLSGKYDVPPQAILNREHISGDHAPLQQFIPQRDFDGSKPGFSNVIDERDMKFSSGNVALKFHAVKFDKDGHTRRSGASGRPLKAFANAGQFRRFPPEMNPSVFNDPFPRPFIKPQPHSGASSSHRVFPQRQRPHQFSPYNKHHRDTVGQHRQGSYHAANANVGPPNEMFGYSKSDGATSSSYRQGSGLRRPFVDNRNFSQSSKLSLHSSFQKRPGSDMSRRRSQEYPSIMGSPSRSHGAPPPQGRKFFDDFDEDVMKRCIRKAQHELNRTATKDEPNKRSSSETSSSNISNLHQRKVKEETFADSRLNVAPIAPDRSSPISFLQSSQKLLPDSRSKLTMTPGFDTNGEDSSKDDEMQPPYTRPLLIHSKRSKHEGETPPASASTSTLKSSGGNDQQSRFRGPNSKGEKQPFKLDLAEKSMRSPIDAGVKEGTKRDEKSQWPKSDEMLAIDFSGSSNENRVEKDHKDMHQTSLKRGSTDAETEAKHSTLTSDILGEEYVKSPTAKSPNEATFQPIQSPDSDSSFQTKKFVQKIKLRAIKSQDKHGYKKWTLVGDNRVDGIGNESQAMDTKMEENQVTSKEIEPITITSDGSDTNKAFSPKQTDRHSEATSPNSKSNLSINTNDNASPNRTTEVGSSTKLSHSAAAVVRPTEYNVDDTNKATAIDEADEPKSLENKDQESALNSKLVHISTSPSRAIASAFPKTEITIKPNDSNEIKETCLSMFVDQDFHTFLHDDNTSTEKLNDQSNSNMQEKDTAELCTNAQKQPDLSHASSILANTKLLLSKEQVPCNVLDRPSSEEKLNEETSTKASLEDALPLHDAKLKSLTNLVLKESVLCKPIPTPFVDSDSLNISETDVSLTESILDSTSHASIQQSSFDKDEVNLAQAIKETSQSFSNRPMSSSSLRLESQSSIPTLSTLAEKICDSSKTLTPAALPDKEHDLSTLNNTSNVESLFASSTTRTEESTSSKMDIDLNADKESSFENTIDSDKADDMLELTEYANVLDSSTPLDDVTSDKNIPTPTVTGHHISPTTEEVSSVMSSDIPTSNSAQCQRSPSNSIKPPFETDVTALSEIKSKSNEPTEIVNASEKPTFISSTKELPKKISRSSISPVLSNRFTEEAVIVKLDQPCANSPVDGNAPNSVNDSDVPAPFESAIATASTVKGLTVDSFTDRVLAEHTSDEINLESVKETDSCSLSEERKEPSSTQNSKPIPFTSKVETCLSDSSLELPRSNTTSEPDSFPSNKKPSLFDSNEISICESSLVGTLFPSDDSEGNSTIQAGNYISDKLATPETVIDSSAMATSLPSTSKEDEGEKKIVDHAGEDNQDGKRISPFFLSKEAIHDQDNNDGETTLSIQPTSLPISSSTNEDELSAHIASETTTEGKETMLDDTAEKSKPPFNRPTKKQSTRKFKRLFTRKKTKNRFLSKDIKSPTEPTSLPVEKTSEPNVAKESGPEEATLSKMSLPTDAREAASSTDSTRKNVSPKLKTKPTRPVGRPRKIKRRRIPEQSSQSVTEDKKVVTVQLKSVEIVSVKSNPVKEKNTKRKISSNANMSADNEERDKSEIVDISTQLNLKQLHPRGVPAGPGRPTSGTVRRSNNRFFKRATRGRKKASDSGKDVAANVSVKNQVSFENRKKEKRMKTRSFESPAESAETSKTQSAGRGRKRSRGSGRFRGQRKPAEPRDTSEPSSAFSIKARGAPKNLKRHMSPVQEQAKRGRKRAGKHLKPVRRSIRNYEKVVVAKK